MLFFVLAYTMYKYQLLFVYINDYQSGGYMWYALFNHSLIALLFASVTLLGYLGLQLNETYLAGPFYFFFPLPFAIIYFMYYCESKFKKQSMVSFTIVILFQKYIIHLYQNLSFGFAKEFDQRSNEKKSSNKPTPHDTFNKILYRQPSLIEKAVYPEPYRSHSIINYFKQSDDNKNIERVCGSLSIDLETLTVEGEHEHQALDNYFHDFVIPLAKEGEEIEKAKKLLGKDFRKKKIELRNLKNGKKKHVLLPSTDEKEIIYDEYEQYDDDVESPLIRQSEV